MPEVHLPQLEQDGGHGPSSRRKEYWKVLIEVTLISLGVFLGIAGEGWRESVHRRELARQSLEQFRSEIVANQTAVKAVLDYHKKALDQISVVVNARSPEERQNAQVHLEGIQPVVFQTTAWDVGLATQALGDMDRDLVYDLSHIYNEQKAYADLTRGILQAMYIDPPEPMRNGEVTDRVLKFLRALYLYYNDVTVSYEPALLKEYEAVLPKIESTLANGR